MLEQSMQKLFKREDVIRADAKLLFPAFWQADRNRAKYPSTYPPTTAAVRQTTPLRFHSSPLETAIDCTNTEELLLPPATPMPAVFTHLVGFPRQLGGAGMTAPEKLKTDRPKKPITLAK